MRLCPLLDNVVSNWCRAITTEQKSIDEPTTKMHSPAHAYAFNTKFLVQVA